MNKYAKLYFSGVRQKLAGPMSLLTDPIRNMSQGLPELTGGSTDAMKGIGGGAYNLVAGDPTKVKQNIGEAAAGFRRAAGGLGQTALGVGQATPVGMAANAGVKAVNRISQAAGGTKPQVAEAAPSISAGSLGLSNAGALGDYEKRKADMATANSAAGLGLSNAGALAQKAQAGNSQFSGGPSFADITGNANTQRPTILGSPSPAPASSIASGAATPEEIALLGKLHGSGAKNRYNPNSSLDQKNLAILRKATQEAGGTSDFNKLRTLAYAEQYGQKSPYYAQAQKLRSSRIA